MDTITTPAAVYSPPSTAILHNSQASLTDRAPTAPVHLVQYDQTVPIIAVSLTENDSQYTIPTGAAVNVRMDKPDGKHVYNPALGISADGKTVYIGVTVQMTTAWGRSAPIIEIVVGGGIVGSAAFPVIIDENPVPESAIESTDEFLTIQQILVQVQAAAKIVSDNEAAIQAVEDNVDAIQQAPTAAANAAASATLAESWAVGGTGTREGENTNNAQYWCNQAQTIAQGALGWYETEEALQAAHPTGQNGQWAIVGTTDTIWTWDSDTNAWVNSGAQIDLSNYYTKEQANAAFATAEQGALAASAVQSVNGVTPAAGGALTLPICSVSLLWTNSQTSTFAGQTVSLDLSGYDAAIIVTMLKDGDQQGESKVCSKNVSECLMVCEINEATIISFRKVTVANSGVSFGESRIFGTGSVDNTKNIPSKIYGVKY